jgi:hypothetical protein
MVAGFSWCIAIYKTWLTLLHWPERQNWTAPLAHGNEPMLQQEI